MLSNKRSLTIDPSDREAGWTFSEDQCGVDHLYVSQWHPKSVTDKAQHVVSFFFFYQVSQFSPGKC